MIPACMNSTYRIHFAANLRRDLQHEDKDRLLSFSWAHTVQTA